MKLKSVEIGALTTHRLRSKAMGRRFLSSLIDVAPQYVPERFNVHEPVNLSFDVEQAIAMWGASFLWRRAKPPISGQVVFGPAAAHDAIYLSMPPKAFDETTLRAWFAELDAAFGVELAYVHVRTDADSLDVDRYKLQIMPFAQGLTTHHLREGIPDFPWALLLGPTYIDYFGRDRVACVPAASVVPAGRGVLITLTPAIGDVTANPTGYSAAQESAKRHLNRRGFRARGAVAEAPELLPSVS